VRLHRGCTRVVVLVGPVALKFPRWYGKTACLLGVLDNLRESAIWNNYDEASRWLCPVWWCAPLGFVLVMKRLNQATPSQVDTFKM